MLDASVISISGDYTNPYAPTRALSPLLQPSAHSIPLLLATNAPVILQGKAAELRLELNSGGKKDKNHSAKKIALKKIVANMTMSNNDMVALFPDIIQCIQIPSLEVKKM